MRDFTPEEKELIINTPITRDCFEMNNFKDITMKEAYPFRYGVAASWNVLIESLEYLRKMYSIIKDESYFIELVRLLPNSYKVVKL